VIHDPTEGIIYPMNKPGEIFAVVNVKN